MFVPDADLSGFAEPIFLAGKLCLMRSNVSLRMQLTVAPVSKRKENVFPPMRIFILGLTFSPIEQTESTQSFINAKEAVQSDKMQLIRVLGR